MAILRNITLGVPIEVTVNNKWIRKGQKVIKGLENWTQSGMGCQGRSL